MAIAFWSGRGYLVLLAGLVAFMLGSAIVDIGNLQQPLVGAVHVALQGLAGIGLWLFSRHVENTPARVFTEKATGREIRLRKTAGTFFSIRTRYWAFILPALAALITTIRVLNPPI